MPQKRCVGIFVNTGNKIVEIVYQIEYEGYTYENQYTFYDLFVREKCILQQEDMPRYSNEGNDENNINTIKWILICRDPNGIENA